MIGKTLDLEDRRIANPTLSPDGRWLAYVSGETGRREIFLRSYPDLQKKIPVGPGTSVRWSSSGDRMIVVRSAGRRIVEIAGADFDPTTGDVALCNSCRAGPVRSRNCCRSGKGAERDGEVDGDGTGQLEHDRRAWIEGPGHGTVANPRRGIRMTR